MSTPPMPDCDAIRSLPELIAYTHAMETEAAERYLELADQLEVHNNPEVADMFRRLSGLSDDIKALCLARGEGLGLPRIAPWDYRFECIELLAAGSVDDVHYLMTPHHVVSLALKCKQRMVEFFRHISDARDDQAMRGTALTLMQAQSEQVALLERWLADCAEPEEGWHEDPDPPTTQE